MSDDIIEVSPVIQRRINKDSGKQAKPARGKGKKTRRNVESHTESVAKTLTLAAQGLCNKDIAKVQGVNPAIVSHRLDVFIPLFKEIENVASYRLSKSDILEAAELAALKRVLEVLPNADVRSATFAFDKIFTAGRLTRGESTANLSTKVTRFTEVNLTEVLPHTITLPPPD